MEVELYEMLEPSIESGVWGNVRIHHDNGGERLVLGI